MTRISVIASAFLLGGLAVTAATAQNVPPAKPGFPVTLTGGGNMIGGHPTVGDLSLTPGHKSVVFCTAAGKLYVVNYDGSVASGFPVTMPGECAGTVAIGDINNDGVAEIVVPYGFFSPASPGGVAAYNNKGTLLWKRVSSDFNGDGIPEGVVDAPAIADVDHDGITEVAWGSLDAHIYLVNGSTGADKPGWPIFVRDTIFSSPALADVDNDGNLEIIIGADAHQEGAPYNTPNGGCLHVIHPNGTELTGFPKCVDQVITSSPAVGDINGDGRLEIVVGTGTYWPNGSHKVYAFEPDGTYAAGWPVSVDGQVSTSPALADINGDGNPEVIVTDDMSSPSTAFHVYAFQGNGTLLWKTAPKNYFGTSNVSAGDPLVADVIGDGGLEVLDTNNTELSVLDAANGTQLSDDGTHFAGSFSFFTPAADRGGETLDWEADGVAVEVVAISSPHSSDTSDTEVFVWNPKVPTTWPWGTYHQNARHTGLYPSGRTSFYSLTPCRAVDTRNASGPYGGPALSSGTQRVFTLGGQCGVPVGAAAIAANITVVAPPASGTLVAWPGTGATPPANVTTLNYRSGHILANNSILGLDASGDASIEVTQSSGTCNVLVDIFGYFQ